MPHEFVVIFVFRVLGGVYIWSFYGMQDWKHDFGFPFWSLRHLLPFPSAAMFASRALTLARTVASRTNSQPAVRCIVTTATRGAAGGNGNTTTEAPLVRKPRFVALSGSSRKDSWNTKLLLAAVEIMSAQGNADVEYVDATQVDIPVYNQDLESSSGHPEAALHVKEALPSC